MTKFIVKSMMVVSFLTVCPFPSQVYSANQTIAQMSPGQILSEIVSNVDKRPSAEKKEAPTIKPAMGGKAVKEVEEEEQNIMEDALVLLEESDVYWKKGDLENALDLLDQAYELVIETNGDPAIARQKDDLRLLISKRILAIYSSRQPVTVGKRSEIPMIMNADVEKEIRNFQSFERDFFIASYQRSGLFRPMIVRELKKVGLPEELSWLPLVESGFKISALSKARALGPWQFIPSTGYKYGLNRDEWIDERMDPEKSTRAAISYFKDLHSMFGDWLTVLAGYNCGEGRVLRVISGQNPNYLDRFWDLYQKLPYETARYVPRFLATLHIIRDPAKYGMDLGQPMDKRPPWEEVKSNKTMRLQDIAAALALQEDTLNNLNPELRHHMTPDREYSLKVPVEAAEKYLQIADSIQQVEKPKQIRLATKSGFKRHKVKRGETVASIAHHYSISVSALMQCNGLSVKRGVRVGQHLKVPLQIVRYTSRQPSERDGGQKGNLTRYKIKQGDTLSSIAQKFNTTSQEIKKLNKLKGNSLKAGKIIKVSDQIASAKTGGEPSKQINERSVVKKKSKDDKVIAHKDTNSTYKVRKGDSLDKIARKNNVKVARILELNNLEKRDSIQPGQLIVVR